MRAGYHGGSIDPTSLFFRPAPAIFYLSGILIFKRQLSLGYFQQLLKRVGGTITEQIFSSELRAPEGMKMLCQLFTQRAFAGRFGPNNYYFFYHTDRLLNSAITQRGFDLNVAFAASLFSANL